MRIVEELPTQPLTPSWTKTGYPRPPITATVGPVVRREPTMSDDPAAPLFPRTNGGGRLREPRWGFVRRLHRYGLWAVRLGEAVVH